MPQTGYCTDVTCIKELTELYECHCCSWMICLKHLLEHVEIVKREKNQQIEDLKKQLETLASTLEMIIEKKIQEIEREKQLIEQVKMIMNKSTYTFEEMHILYEDINQAILANRKEETIVKVEPILSEMKTCCTNDHLMTDTLELPINSSSASNYILQQPSSPVYQPMIFRSMANDINASVRSSTPKQADQSTDISYGFNSTNNETGEIQGNYQRTLLERYGRAGFQCPLTFDSAFGINKAKDTIKLCPDNGFCHRNVSTHFYHKHGLKGSCAKRIFVALQSDQDPKTTILFDDNEEIIDRARYIPCPFSNSTIHLIGCCPTESRNVPCQYDRIRKFEIAYHLRAHHRIPISKGKKIAKTYQNKFTKITDSNTNSS